MKDLAIWIGLIFGQWQTWASGGGVGGFITILVYVIERLKGRTMKNEWYVLIFIIAFILGASFVVWKNEYSKRISLETQIAKYQMPIFSSQVDILASSAAGSREEDTLLAVIVTIKNSGAPSIADSFIVTAKLDGREMEALILPPPQDKIQLWRQTEKEGEGLTLESKNFLLRKCSEQPIPSGGSCVGFLMLLVRNANFRDIATRGRVIVVFSDAFNKTYTIESKSYTGILPREILMDQNKLQKH
jgi:hypothetical protein